MTDKKTKFCNKCETERRKEEFSKCKSKKDGLASTCKNCVKQYRINNKEILKEKAKIYKLTHKLELKEWRKRNKNKTKKYRKKYINSEKGKETKRRYKIKHKDEIREKNKEYKKTEKAKIRHKIHAGRYKKKYRIKYLARKKLEYAVNSGKIIRPKFCSICNKTDCVIHGHHENYSKPLEVVWSCKQCHDILDEQRREKERLLALKSL